MAEKYYPYNLNENQLKRFDDLDGTLGLYGYWVESYPIEGEEEKWLQGIKEALVYIENKIEMINEIYNSRGRSKKALNQLHMSLLYDKKWGIEIGFGISKIDNSEAIKRQLKDIKKP